jgi:hypothetical protein
LVSAAVIARRLKADVAIQGSYGVRRLLDRFACARDDGIGPSGAIC